MKLRILFLISCLIGLAGTSQAQTTITFVNCSGTNDTAAFSAIIAAIGAATGTINIPYKASTANRCAVNTLSIPANITIDNTNGIGIKVNSGQTLTVLGAVVAPVGKTNFFGPGTTTFAGNTVVGASGQAAIADGSGSTAYATVVQSGTSAGGDLTGTYPNPTLTTSGVSAATYGSTTQAPVIAVDAKGRITSASNATISGTAPGGSAGGDLTGTYPNPTLTTTAVGAGSFGSATQVGTFTVDSKGRLTAAGNTTITGTVPGGSAGGDLTGTYPNPTLAAVGAATSCTFCSITTDTKGRVTSKSTGTPIIGGVGSTDNGIPRADGTGGFTLQGSATAVITDAGNMGIGTADPIFNDDGSTGANIGRWLAVDGTAAGSGFAAYFGVGGTIPGVNDRVGALNFFNYSMGGVDNRTASIFSFNDGALGRGNLQFNTSSSNLGPLTRMEISYTGEVGIGHTASRLSNVRLQVAGMGATNSTYSLLLYNNADLPNYWFADGGKVFFATSDVTAIIAPYSGGIFHVGTTGQFTAFANGDVLAKNYRSLQPIPPTCSSNCGTSPSIAGSDSVMRVTMGSSGSPASGFVVTFNGTWAAAPACVASSALTTMVVGKLPISVQTTTTTATITTNGTAPGNNDVYSLICMGTQ